jgi:hypothetical protein
VLCISYNLRGGLINILDLVKINTLNLGFKNSTKG